LSPGRFGYLTTHEGEWLEAIVEAAALHFTLAQHLVFNFPDEERQVGADKAQAGGWDAMMFSIRWYMLVVGEAACQASIIRVFPGIIPIALLLTLPDFIRVSGNALAGEIKTFVHAQHNTTVELNLTFHDSDHRTAGINAYRVPSHCGRCVQKNVDGLTV